MPKKIKVLFTAADTAELGSGIRMDHELRAIKEAVLRSPNRELLDLEVELGVRGGGLQEAIDRYQPDIVHFAGHAHGSAGILVEDEHGEEKVLSPEWLRDLFAHSPSVRVVVLNACDSLPIIQAIHDVVDYGIGMNREVGDLAATRFAEGFYAALASSRTVEAAFMRGVLRMKDGDASAATVPEIIVRDGVDAAMPFVLQSAMPYQNSHKWPRIREGIQVIQGDHSISFVGKEQHVSFDQRTSGA
jgi:hypothetical protein